MIKISAPAHPNDGCTYFRILVPSTYFPSDISVDPQVFLMGKYSRPASTTVPFLDRTTNSSWDWSKLIERYIYSLRQNNFDGIWLSRSLLCYPNKIEKLIRNVIYDFDDAIWLNSEGSHCLEDYCRRARVVIAGNNFLADYALKFSSKVVVIPTSVDTNRYKRISKVDKSIFSIGWIGSSSGFSYLKNIEQQLLEFLSGHHNAKLTIVAERYPTELQRIRKYIDFRRWNRANDVEDINSFSVGLMPLSNEEWDRGKCSLKMLQYMACEVPVLASGVGMNTEVFMLSKGSGDFGMAVQQGEWCEALKHLAGRSAFELNRLGKNGRHVVEQNFSTEKIAKLLEVTIKQVFY